MHLNAWNFRASLPWSSRSSMPPANVCSRPSSGGTSAAVGSVPAVGWWLERSGDVASSSRQQCGSLCARHWLRSGCEQPGSQAHGATSSGGQAAAAGCDWAGEAQQARGHSSPPAVHARAKHAQLQFKAASQPGGEGSNPVQAAAHPGRPPPPCRPQMRTGCRRWKHAPPDQCLHLLRAVALERRPSVGCGTLTWYVGDATDESERQKTQRAPISEPRHSPPANRRSPWSEAGTSWRAAPSAQQQAFGDSKAVAQALDCGMSSTTSLLRAR